MKQAAPQTDELLASCMGVLFTESAWNFCLVMENQ
jgi:hypothetical protein